MSRIRHTIESGLFALALAALPFADANAQTAVPPGTEVLVKTVEAMSSTTAITGQKFAVEVAADVIVDGQVAIPAGTRGSGTVIFARKKGVGGRPGALDLRVDSVETATGSIRLKSNETNRGEDKRRGGTAAAIAFGILGAVAVQGKDIAVAAGTQINTVVAPPRPTTAAAAAAPVATAEPPAATEPATAPVAETPSAPVDATAAPASDASAPTPSEPVQKDPQ